MGEILKYIILFSFTYSTENVLQDTLSIEIPAIEIEESLYEEKVQIKPKYFSKEKNIIRYKDLDTLHIGKTTFQFPDGIHLNNNDTLEIMFDEKVRKLL